MAVGTTNVIDAALGKAAGPLGFAFLFSFASNILYLALPLYMIQLSRVYASESIPTLVVLTLATLWAFTLSGVLDHYRSSILIQFGLVFDRLVSRHLFEAAFAEGAENPTGQTQAIRDLDYFRQVLTGSGVAVVFDLPWAPIFMLALFAIDPYIGVLCLVGGFVLLALCLLQDKLSRKTLSGLNAEANRGYQFVDMAVRNAEVARALGMIPALNTRWSLGRTIVLDGQARASELAGVVGDLIKFTRMLVQVLVLAVGTYLVLKHTISPGVLFANMILSSKALAPFERVIGSWQYLVEAAQAYKRLRRLLGAYQPHRAATSLPTPRGLVEVQHLTFALPGLPEPLLKGINFTLQPGEALGVLGPSGAGKSTLARILIGVWHPTDGTVRLDGAEVTSWDRTAFGRHVGYLPQDTELFTGSVRDNIARFRTDVADDAIHRAAMDAGIHDLVMRLPSQYDTELGATGHVLSVGQRQRLGLARALLGGPSLIVLDEPNANLDTTGEQALLDAIETLKKRGCTVVVISHRASVFRHVDKILWLVGGTVRLAGKRDDVLAALMQPVDNAGHGQQAPLPVSQSIRGATTGSPELRS